MAITIYKNAYHIAWDNTGIAVSRTSSGAGSVITDLTNYYTKVQLGTPGLAVVDFANIANAYHNDLLGLQGGEEYSDSAPPDSDDSSGVPDVIHEFYHLSAVDYTRLINLTFIDSLIENSDFTVHLDGDVFNPGPGMYYGTADDSLGEKGWYELPTGGDQTPHPPFIDSIINEDSSYDKYYNFSEYLHNQELRGQGEWTIGNGGVTVFPNLSIGATDINGTDIAVGFPIGLDVMEWSIWHFALRITQRVTQGDTHIIFGDMAEIYDYGSQFFFQFYLSDDSSVSLVTNIQINSGDTVSFGVSNQDITIYKNYTVDANWSIVSGNITKDGSNIFHTGLPLRKNTLPNIVFDFEASDGQYTNIRYIITSPSDIGYVHLVGDVAYPGPNKYYGTSTDTFGTKGWYIMPEESYIMSIEKSEVITDISLTISDNFEAYTTGQLVGQGIWYGSGVAWEVIDDSLLGKVIMMVAPGLTTYANINLTDLVETGGFDFSFEIAEAPVAGYIEIYIGNSTYIDIDSSSSYMYIYTEDDYGEIESDTAFESGDVLMIRRRGLNWTMYRNGVIDTTWYDSNSGSYDLTGDAGEFVLKSPYNWDGDSRLWFCGSGTSAKLDNFSITYNIGEMALVDGVHLVNDQDDPGTNMYYGTDLTGVKGWYELPEAYLDSSGNPIGGDQYWEQDFIGDLSPVLAGAGIYVDHFTIKDATIELDAADGVIINEAPLYIKAGDLGGGDYAGSLYLSSGFGGIANRDLYFGHPNYDGTTFQVSTEGTATNINLTIESKGVGYLQLMGSATGLIFGRRSAYSIEIINGLELADSGVTQVVMYDTIGQRLYYGDGTGIGTTLSGSTNNTVCTVTGVNAIQGEANLTFDGTDLVNSAGYMYADDFVLNSDRRLKTNIESYVSKELDIEYKQFELKSHLGTQRFGVLAQDIMKGYPELVREDVNGSLSVSYIDLLVREVSSLKDRVKKLESR